METLPMSDVVLGLLSFIILIVSGGVKMLWAKVSKNEDEIKSNREKMYREMKEVHTKHDTSSEKLRDEIGKMSDSLREDIAKQSVTIADNNKAVTELLLKIASK